MSDDERIQMARLATAFEGFVERYDREQEQRDEWRKKMEKKLDPIYRHHQVIVIGGKWIVYVVGGAFAAVKAWFTVSDHFGK